MSVAKREHGHEFCICRDGNTDEERGIVEEYDVIKCKYLIFKFIHTHALKILSVNNHN